MADSLPNLPNPLTPLAWLPPDEATQFQITRYITIGCFGAWIWDVLVSLPEELLMVRTAKLRFSDAVYFVSRIAQAAFLGSRIAFGVAHIKHCQALESILGWTGSIQYVIHALLFIFRIRAVFHDQPIVVWAFHLMWLAVVGTCLTAPFGLESVPLGQTGLCLQKATKNFVAATIIVSAVYDTLVFASITIKLLEMSQGAAPSWKAFWSGQGLGNVSRMVLQTGQLYYLVTAGSTISAAACVLSPDVPLQYGDSMITVNGFITNVMATRVYRLLKLGYIRDPDTLPTVQQVSSVQFQHTLPHSVSSEVPTQTTVLSSQLPSLVHEVDFPGDKQTSEPLEGSANLHPIEDKEGIKDVDLC
ncbi:hypothetical protein EIP91_009647 [Steccherinum ochraceum]|uniref:Integral membrane protein n=1 Tax=Steccherinum ochraceum TaxID=92696 RepID=A0A4R0R1E5_9APHY|nr:hypothetical protein EIP91_009647 [Steccherinum ochraceum]